MDTILNDDLFDFITVAGVCWDRISAARYEASLTNGGDLARLYYELDRAGLLTYEDPDPESDGNRQSD